MLCHHCNLLIGNKVNYVRLTLSTIPITLFFHCRHKDDCFDQYVHENPTVRVMEVNAEALVEHKVHYLS